MKYYQLKPARTVQEQEPTAQEPTAQEPTAQEPTAQDPTADTISF